MHHADVAQLVEHHLAKVRVAGSSPVIRSGSPDMAVASGGVAERRGSGLQSRIHGFESRRHLEQGWRDWRSGSALPSHGRGHWFDPSIAHGVRSFN